MLAWHISAFGNEPPVITLATNEAILGESSAFELRFTVTDVDSTLGLTNIHALSFNSDLVPNAASNLMLWAGTNEGSFGLTIVPATNRFGSALIVLSASDGENESTNIFVLQVRKTPAEPPNLSQIPIDDLLGYWPAENDARDALGLHNGSLINGTSFGPGTLGQAFDFDGQDDYVEIGGSSFYSGLIATWIHPARLEQGKTIIAVKGEAGSLPKFELSLLADSEGVAALQVAMDTITNFITFSGTTSIKTGAWTHVAVTVSAYSLKLYVNGQLDVNLADPGWMSAGQEDRWWIGKGDGFCFHGRIDELAWYGTPPLSVEQIQSLYELGRAGTAGPPQILRQPQGLNAGIGSVAQFSVVAASPGGLPLSYQWQFNGEDLRGEIEDALSLKGVRLDQSGSYRVVVRNELGSVTSSAVELAVSGLIAWGQDSGSGELNVPKDLMDIVAIAVGGERNLVLRSDGTLFSWGSRITGVLAVPLGETNLLSMSTDGLDTFLVYPNREVYRLNSTGTLAPTGWKDVVAFSVNGNRQMALRSDGTVRAWNVLWGWNDEYDTAWLTNAVAVAAGANHCLALRADGTVVVFGADIHDGSMYGQTNIPPGLSNVVAIATSYYHNLALKADGTLVAWGGYLDEPWYWGWNDWMTNTPPEATNLVAISAGQTCNLALRADGRVIQWGSPDWGWTNGSPNFPNAVAIGVGCAHALMLLKDGTPQVTVQPWDQTVAFGGESSFAAKVVGKQGMTYQWEFNGTSISGATNQSYRLKDVKLADEGLYSVSVSNPMGTVTSRKAKLLVKDASRPVQLSPVSMTGGCFVLRINGSVGLSYIIQTSADLRAWSNISTSTPTAGVWDFIDPDSATATNRFYRVQLAP